MLRDGSTAITERQQLVQGSWVHQCSSGGGTNGYWRICEINITGTYCNQPIEITYTQRGNNQTCHLYIRFGSTNNTAPALESLTYRGTTNGAYSVTSGSTTSIYVRKSEAYDQLGILEFLKDSYDAFTVAWKDEFVSSLPSGYKTATQVFSPGTANTAQVLTGYTFSSANGTNLSGTMANRGNLNWSGSNTTYSVPAGYYSGGTLDSRTSYNNGVNAGKNSVSGGGVSKSYSATAKNVNNNAPNYRLTGISGTGYIIGFIWIKRVWGDNPSRTFTVTNGSPSTVVNYVWDNYQKANSASEMGIWFVKVRITNASNASAYFRIRQTYNPEFLLSIHFFAQ